MLLDLCLLCNQKNIIFSIFSMILHLDVLDRKQLNATRSNPYIIENFEKMIFFGYKEDTNLVT